MDLRFAAGPFLFLSGEGVHRFLCQFSVNSAGEAVATDEAVEGCEAPQTVLHIHQPKQEFPVILHQPGRELFVSPVDFIGQVLYPQ